MHISDRNPVLPKMTITEMYFRRLLVLIQSLPAKYSDKNVAVPNQYAVKMMMVTTMDFRVTWDRK